MLVGVVDRLGECLHHFGRLTHGEGGAVQLLREAAAGHEFQAQEREAGVLAHFVDLDDVGMLHPGDRFGLGPEPGQRLHPGRGAGLDHLQGHRPRRKELAGLVDDAHAAPAQDA
jgi:hypothetical protein